MQKILGVPARKQFNVKWPVRVIQGRVFWGQWKGDNVGLIFKGSEDVASENTENRRF